VREISRCTVAEQTTIDPYGGFEEEWSIDLLNSASQNATIAFTMPAVRPMPQLNQITFPDAAHDEICGFDCLCCAAYAVGVVDDYVGSLHAVLADARRLGYDPNRGSDLDELMGLAQRQGWSVEPVTGRAGDVAAQLVATGRVGLTALTTTYGTGANWNVLHPQAGGRIGHWEGVGAVNATSTGGSDMDPAKEETLNQLVAWQIYEAVLGRIADKDGFAWALGVARKSYTDLLWAVVNGDEYKATGGLLGRLAAMEARIDALAQLVARDDATALHGAG